MYNEQLEKLIEMALMDGELTEKEKQILFKKAESFGVDLDEFEMVLEAKLFDKKQSMKKEEPAVAAPKSDKFGDVRKCPACGAILQSFQIRCDECGHEFSNVVAVNSAQNLFDLLQAASLRNSQMILNHEEEKTQKLTVLDQQHNQAKMDLSAKHNQGGFGKTLGNLVNAGAISGRENEERDDLIASQKEQRKALENSLDDKRKQIEKNLHLEKANIIKNFPVPNTKEDLLELLAMATSNAYDNDRRMIGKEEEVWIQKCDQVYTKIKAVAIKDIPFLDQATTMIFSLMKRLPKKHQRFTQIPENMRTKIEAELARDAVRLKEKRIPIFKRYGITFGICILPFILGIIIEMAIITIIGFIAIIVVIILFFNAMKKAKQELL